MRNLEKTFILSETINPAFFETGKSVRKEQFDTLAFTVAEELKRLKNQKGPELEGLSPILDSSLISFEKYRQTFAKTCDMFHQKGFKDFGLEGDLRRLIHKVESEFSNRNDYKLTVLMLTLRRHEKDFLLRKDISYKDRFALTNQALIKILQADNRNQALIEYLQQYNILFNRLIEIELAIGMNTNEGLIGELNRHSQIFEGRLSYIQKIYQEKARESINRAVVMLFFLIGVISIAAIFLIFRVSRHIVGSIRQLQGHILKLGAGQLIETIPISGNNEITRMEGAINILSENLKRTRDFANEVGNGNFESEINVFDNQGDLGSALIEMRNKLFQVSREREAQKIIDQRRIWETEGLALFNQLVRDKKGLKLNELSFEVLRNLVKYTQSNQGGIFIINDSQNEPELEQVAVYAYDRRKIAAKKVKMLEGLVGTCFMENETTYMTDIPHNYIEITSGLGKATPKAILLVPVKTAEKSYGVLEIASFNEYQKYEISLIERVCEMFASVIQNVIINEQTLLLLETTKEQTHELTSQEEELRQNMEELQAIQDTMMVRERELQSMLEDKNHEIVQLRKQYQEQKLNMEKRLSWYVDFNERVDSTFLHACFNLDGSLKECNERYRKMLVPDNEPGHLFFSRSLSHQLSENKQEWNRIVNGEAYQGTIMRVDSRNRHVQIFASISPNFDKHGNVADIIFLGHCTGYLDDSNKKGQGIWLRDLVDINDMNFETMSLS